MEPSPSTHCRVYYPFTCVVLSQDNVGNTFGHATPKANIADGPLQPLLDRDNTIARENLNLICLTRRREAENILNRTAGRLKASDGTPRLRENIHQLYLPMQSGRTFCGSWESCGLSFNMGCFETNSKHRREPFACERSKVLRNSTQLG